EKKLGWSLNQEEPERKSSQTINDAFGGNSITGFSTNSAQGGKQSENSNGKTGRELSLDDDGDVRMGGINTAKVAGNVKGRAKWKSRAQLDRLKQEGKCFRFLSIGKGGDATRDGGKLDAPAKSRSRELNAGTEKVVSLNTSPFLVNALLNDSLMVQALVDNGCLCFGIIDEALTTKLDLPRIPITPRYLETAEASTDNKPIVKDITFVSLDLDGYTTDKLWLYVVPQSSHPMILGKKWLEDQDAVIHSREQRLELRKQNGSVCSAKQWRENFRNVANPKNSSAKEMASLIGNVPVCKATIEDIGKALRGKPKLTLNEARSRLPDQVKDFAHLFADDGGANELPTLRGDLDHAINLRQEGGKPLTPPWGPLYNMSREELLVLRKTLTDLLSKGWIRPSSSSAASPVLFAKK
ncbi:hypothetical protein K3495_g15624, partial [Podosphaera aphanis]